MIQKALNLSIADNNCIKPPSRDQLELNPVEYSQYKKLFTDNHGSWRGGRKQYFEFPFPAKELLFKLQSGERPSFKKDFHYFPTPDEVISFMANIELPLYDGKFLEPSAGQGAIPEWIDLNFPRWNHKWDVIEIHPLNRKVLKEKGFNLIHDDFGTFEPIPVYDLIFANPPFKHDALHVSKMVGCLAKSGSIVTVLPSTFPSKQEELIKDIKTKFEDVLFYSLPEGSFKKSGTMVNSVIMHCADKKS